MYIRSQTQDVYGMTYFKVQLPRTFRGPIASAELPLASVHTDPCNFFRLTRFTFPGLFIMKNARKNHGSAVLLARLSQGSRLHKGFQDEKTVHGRINLGKLPNLRKRVMRRGEYV